MVTLSVLIIGPDETMPVTAEGFITRVMYVPHGPPTWLVRGSASWRIIGAVTCNNFGHVVKRWTCREVLDTPEAIPWKWKNGKQRSYLLDYDHGSNRRRESPGYVVARAPWGYLEDRGIA